MDEMMLYNRLEPSAKYIAYIKVVCLWLLAGVVVAICLLAIRMLYEKLRMRNAKERETEGIVVSKCVCYPRANKKSPIMLIPQSRREEARKTGECELLVYVACLKTEYVASGWVTPELFDSVKLDSKVRITYVPTRKKKRRFRSITVSV